MRTLNWAGISAKWYSFEVYPSNLNFRSVPGIYLLCGEGPDGQPEPLHMVETKSFHDAINCKAASDGFSRVALFPCGGAIARHRNLNDLSQALYEKANGSLTGQQ
jgi:hypothetical protein